MIHRTPSRYTTSISHRFLYLALLLAIWLCSMALRAQTINISIDTREDRALISPLIYGINAYVYDSEWGDGPWKVGLDNHESGLNVPFRRLGGNTMTSYNWENGFSNSGNDDNHSNNSYQSYITGAGSGPYMLGAALTTFHDHSRSTGAVSLLQLPAAGFVAADDAGPVSQAEAAPSSRWKEVAFNTNGAFPESPDLSDDKVYVDEEMNFLVNRYGNAASGTGIHAYELDNEPGLWHHYPESGNEGTHSRLHTEQTTCIDVLDRNIALAKTIKRIDSTAETFGPAMWGYAEMYSLWSIYDGVSHQPGDWGNYNIEPYRTNNTGDGYRYNGMTWMNAYLEQMASASEAAERRLLDVFSFHYYPAPGAADDDLSRMQAPRSLWDPTYVESSWITQEGNGFTDGRALQIIPKVQQSIADFYPGTRIAITEYSFGGRHSISGGIAQADALGIFGRTGIYAANYFFTVDDYIASAFRIYRNYDGMNSTFGDTTVRCTTSDLDRSSAYASLDGQGRLHVIVINKSSGTIEANVSIGSQNSWSRADSYGFSNGNTAITPLGSIDLDASSFRMELQPLSVYHLVLTPSVAAVPGERSLTPELSVSPNPCVSAGQVVLRLPQAGRATVTLHDALGRTLRTLLDGPCDGGTRVVPFDASALAPGGYSVLAVVNGVRLSTPLVVVR